MEDEGECNDDEMVGCFDDDSIKSIEARLKQRLPDDVNPEPYIMVGGLFLSAQLFR